MKGVFNFIFTTILTLAFFSNLDAQAWTEKGIEGQLKNIHEITEEFDGYWDGKEIGKGKGYKPFMRWLYRWENQVDAQGNILSHGEKYNTFNAYSKKASATNRSNSAWENLGPNSTVGGYSGTGRVNSIAIDPTNENIVYVGTAGGGLWKSTNGGNSWTPKTDMLGTLGVSTIVIDNNNSDIIYLATGDCEAYDNYSIGVLKSTDGGNTWQTTGLDWSLTNTRVIHKLVQDPDNENTLIAATSIGMYRTTNAGASWTQVMTGNVRDVIARATASTSTYFAVKQVVLNGGIINGEMYRSTNNGSSWNLTQTISGTNRVKLGVSEDNPNYVYALASDDGNSGFLGLYRSTNNGSSFSLRSSSPNLLGWAIDGNDTGGQGWYDLAFTVDPNDVNRVHVGGVNHWYSTNGGTSWTMSNYWTGNATFPVVHSDKHEFLFSPSGDLWESNDGGIYKSTDAGLTWTDKTSNLEISQMYAVGISQTSTRIMAGLQDNGSKFRNNNNWTHEIGGDGMNCAINPDNDDVLYGCIQLGKMRRSLNGGASWSNIHLNIPGTPTGAWVTPYSLDPQNSSTIIAGYDDVWKSEDQGNTWENIGNNVANGGRLEHLVIAPSDSDVIYTGRTNSLYRTIDGGVTWDQMTIPGSPISEITVSTNDPMTIYTVLGNYENGKKVYKSNDGGSTWDNISGSLPNLRALSITIHEDGDETVYVGMDMGVYYRGLSDNDWTLYNTSLPNVEVSDLKIKEATNELFIATYGRGVWKNSTIGTTTSCQSASEIVIDNVDFDNATFSWTAASPAPTNGYECITNTIPVVPNTAPNPVAGTTAYVDGLVAGQEYYFFLRSNCGGGSSSWLTFGPFSVNSSCGATYYDTGGENDNYSNDEDMITTICPSGGQGAVTIDFTQFGVETLFDALYVYNGADENAPLFDSGNGATFSGFPAGGYYGYTLPGSFTSTDPSGCITLRLRSDSFVNDSGYTVVSSCGTPPPSSCTGLVANTDAIGEGSFKEAVQCVMDGDANEVTFDPSVFNKTIILNESLVIDANLIIAVPNGINIDIAVSNAQPTLVVENNADLELKNINIVGSTSTSGTAIQNDGTLILHDSNLVKNGSTSTATSLLDNNGTVRIRGDVNLGLL